MDWQALFILDTPILEIFIRGTVMYLSLIILMRVILKRQTGGMQTSDLLLIILLADASQNGMAGEYTTITDGLILVITLMFWSYLMDWLAFHSPRFERMMQPSPLALVIRGKIQHRNMRKEFVTKAELMIELREHGIDDLAKVKKAWIENDGKISIIPYENNDATFEGADKDPVA